MGELSKSAASLRIVVDDLDPDEITRLLGRPPDRASQKGETLRNKRSQSYPARTGSWSIFTERQIPGCLDSQIIALLDGLSADFEIWETLSKHYKIEIFCGLFLDEFNEGISLSAKTLVKLAERRIVSMSV